MTYRILEGPKRQLNLRQWRIQIQDVRRIYLRDLLRWEDHVNDIRGFRVSEAFTAVTYRDLERQKDSRQWRIDI